MDVMDRIPVWGWKLIAIGIIILSFLLIWFLAHLLILKTARVRRVAEPVFRDRIEEEPKVTGIESFGEYSVNLRVLIKTKPKMQWDVAREYRKRLKEAFDREGIEMPFPQSMTHMCGE